MVLSYKLDHFCFGLPTDRKLVDQRDEQARQVSSKLFESAAWFATEKLRQQNAATDVASSDLPDFDGQARVRAAAAVECWLTESMESYCRDGVKHCPAGHCNLLHC